MTRVRRLALAFLAIAAGAAAALLFTGWGSAVAANVGSVFVTNDAAHAVPVEQSGTADVNVTNTTVPVHEEGKPNVTVSGVVSTRPTIPAGQFSWVNGGSAGNVVSGPDPAGTRYAISSITAAQDTNSIGSGTEGVLAIAAPDHTCQTDGPLFVPVTFGPFISHTEGTTYSLSYPQPYVIEPPNNTDQVCLIVRSIRTGADMSIVGYRF